jgi:hypothetical protein
MIKRICSIYLHLVGAALDVYAGSRGWDISMDQRKHLVISRLASGYNESSEVAGAFRQVDGCVEEYGYSIVHLK